MEKDDKVKRFYVYDASGRLLYPYKGRDKENASLYFPKMKAKDNPSSIFVDVGQGKELLPYSRSENTGWTTVIVTSRKDLFRPPQVGLGLLFSALKMPFSVFLVYSFISTIPRELDEAGIIDGCGSLQLFVRIIFPLLLPVTVTVMVLNFLGSWNEFVFPLYYLNSSSLWPMTLAVYNFFGRYEMSWNLGCADIVLTSLPVVLLYLFGQRFIISGMTSGSVKG